VEHGLHARRRSGPRRGSAVHRLGLRGEAGAVRARPALALGALGLVAVGCTGSTGPAFPTVGDFCVAKAQAECQIAPICAIDPAACQTIREQVCNSVATEETAAPSTRAYTPANAQACIDALKTAYSISEITYQQLVGPGSITDKCERVFVGTADKNQPCQTDYDCISNRVCAMVPATTTTVCADPVAKNQGDGCANPGEQCQGNAYCAGQQGLFMCMPSAQIGQPCSPTVPCSSSLRCQTGTCQARLAAGEACRTGDDCASGAAYCDPYAGDICTVGLTFATKAADCAGYELLPEASSGDGGGSDPVPQEGGRGALGD